MATPTPQLLAGVVLLALVAPVPAFAGTLVLSPMLADEGVELRDRLAVHELIASELDFAPEVGAVAALGTRPPTLDAACLDSVKCLSRIAQANGGDRLLAGRMRLHDDGFELDLVLLDGAALRKQHALVPSDSTALAAAITPLVHALLGTEKKPAPPPPPPPPVVAVAPLAAAAPAIAEAQEIAAAQPPAAAPASDADVAELIQFGGSAGDVSAAEINELIQFAPPPEVVAVTADSAVPAAAAAITVAVEATAPDGIPAGMAGPIAVVPVESPAKPTKEPPPPKPIKDPKPEKEPRVANTADANAAAPFQITGRAGYSRYYTFDFTTAGGEVGVRLIEGLRAIGGVEMYAVNRELTPEEQVETGLASEWNFIFPMNVGLVYEFKFGMFEPYVGADMIVVRYYKDEVGADWAGGARMRAGADLMVSDHVGINLNLAAGFWTGQNWIYIQEGLRETGFLPQVSGGMVVAF
jgi:hypothetical protein